ncbi:hypothetical protein AGOR_G00224880 [Albula goreensis]|uniref:Uncharacterized protein n=1 Tax=Albula goreensis TaxID=1534307 RepID=A0A8T3CK03_9TELE|nr:hypothetical protein AGOR_G00224880 [Albula goreensis]
MNRLRGEVELEKSVRRLRETFHGKIPIERATVLMHRYANNYRVVVQDIILMKDRDLDEEDRANLRTNPTIMNVVQRLEAEERAQAAAPAPQPRPQPGPGRPAQDDRDIQDSAEQLKTLPLTVENLRMFDEAQQNLTPSDIHQFACENCDQDWWRKVPKRKRVSRCRRCKRKYDPVPADRMWGIAEFHCPTCQRTFRGHGCMNVPSPCYSCRSLVMPLRILPPRRRLIGIGLRRQNPHSCLAEDCYNRQEPHVSGTECVHPRSRQRNNKPRVVNPSPYHVSTGSTVNTCLSQGSLLEELDQLILDDIQEEDEDDLSGSDSNSS